MNAQNVHFLDQFSAAVSDFQRQVRERLIALEQNERLWKVYYETPTEDTKAAALASDARCGL